jgi:hypothetical protein
MDLSIVMVVILHDPRSGAFAGERGGIDEKSKIFATVN